MAKHRKQREPRGWMAPREGGYRPQCRVHGREGCHVWTNHCPDRPRVVPPSGGGGVAVRRVV